MNSCIDCAYFQQHKEVIRGPFWSDEDPYEVDSIGGGCHRYPPKAHCLTGKAVFPFVLTGHTCGHFKAKGTP